MPTYLDPVRVDFLFRDCLFRDDEDHSTFVAAEGIITNVGFHPARLESHREEICNMLNDLPDSFKQEQGGGWSFLEACNDREGNLWTGFQRVVEQLVQLGIGIGKVQYQLPRKMWKVLPGGVPYFVILTEAVPVKLTSA